MFLWSWSFVYHCLTDTAHSSIVAALPLLFWATCLLIKTSRPLTLTLIPLIMLAVSTLFFKKSVFGQEHGQFDFYILSIQLWVLMSSTSPVRGVSSIFFLSWYLNLFGWGSCLKTEHLFYSIRYPVFCRAQFWIAPQGTPLYRADGCLWWGICMARSPGSQSTIATALLNTSWKVSLVLFSCREWMWHTLLHFSLLK